MRATATAEPPFVWDEFHPFDKDDDDDAPPDTLRSSVLLGLREPVFRPILVEEACPITGAW